MRNRYTTDARQRYEEAYVYAGKLLRHEILPIDNKGQAVPMSVHQATELVNKRFGRRLQDGTIENIISANSAREALKKSLPPPIGRRPSRAATEPIAPKRKADKRIPNSAKRASAQAAREKGDASQLQDDESGQSGPGDENRLVLPEQQRCAIFVMYAQVLDAPPETEWHGQDGTISSIIKALHMPNGSRNVVKRVLLDSLRCIDEGVPYCSARKLTAVENSRALIQRGSEEEQILADCIEEGQSVKSATSYVNDYRREKGLAHIGVSAVQSWCERMNTTGVSKTSRISKMKQGILN